MTGGNQMTITEIVAIIALVFQGFLVWLAYSAIKRNELTAKKRAIVDHIIKQREDKVLAEVFQELYRLRDEKQKVSEYIKDPENFRRVLYALDTMEFTAVGIRLGAFDEDVYKELQCTKVIKTWESVSGFVMELRNEKQRQTLYQDLELLANRWSANPIKELKKSTSRDR